jgi:transposase
MIIDINKIKLDGGTQSRKMNKDIVAQYAQDMENGDIFPPITVFSNGHTYWPADGFHRIFANKRLKKLTIEADVFEGGAREAEWYGMGSNNKHGFRVTNADKRVMALRILKDFEWGDMSDRQIADHLGVSHVFINKLRHELRDQDKQKKKESKKPAPEVKPDYAAEFSESEVEREQMTASIEMLRKENEDLQDPMTCRKKKQSQSSKICAHKFASWR